MKKQAIDLAQGAEQIGIDGAYVLVHHFARQQASPFPLLAAMGTRTEGLGAAPRGLRRGIARPRDGRPDERGADRSPGGGQCRSGLGDRGAEPAARRRRGAGAADAVAQPRQQEGQARAARAAAATTGH